MSEEHVILFEAPQIIKPEFRLYYDEKGNVICYSCEKLPGKFIVIDAMTYAEGRPDVKVINGQIKKVNLSKYVTKLVPTNKKDFTTAKEDVTILVLDDIVETINWTLKNYEL